MESKHKFITIQSYLSDITDYVRKIIIQNKLSQNYIDNKKYRRF